MKSLLRCLPVAAVAAVAMVAASQPTKTLEVPLRSDPTQVEMAKLQGNWVYTSIVGDQFPEIEYEYDDGVFNENGDYASPHSLDGNNDVAERHPVPDSPLKFEGNQMFLFNSNCTYTLLPGTTPKQIDFMFSDDPAKRVWKGIYAIEGNNLSICLGLSPEVPRPTEFTGKEGSYCSLQTHARVIGVQAKVPSVALRRKRLERVSSIQVTPLIGETCRVAFRSQSDPFCQNFGGSCTGEVLQVENDRLLLNTIEREGATFRPGTPERYRWLTAGIGRERPEGGRREWIPLMSISSITPVREREDGAVGQNDARSDFKWVSGFLGDIHNGRSSPGNAR